MNELLANPLFADLKRSVRKRTMNQDTNVASRSMDTRVISHCGMTNSVGRPKYFSMIL